VQTAETTGPAVPRMRAPRATLAAILFGLTGLIALHDWLGLGGEQFDELAGGKLYDAVVIAAGLACFLRGRIVPRERAGWRILGLAILSWAAGEVYWTWHILGSAELPYPSVADVFYLGFYPLAYTGLALLVRARAHELDWRRWTDAAIAALGTAALGTAFIFDFVADRTAGSSLEVAVSLAYPLGDIAMLAMIVGVVALAGWRPGRVWSLLLLGLGVQVVADVAYTLQSTEGVIPAGNWIDPIYLISAAVLGSVLWQPSVAAMQPTDERGGWRDLAVPAIFAAVMIGLFAMQSIGSTSGLAAALWAATMAAVIVRLALSVNENRRLLEQVRTDSLTGLGNHGGMQVDLEAACGRAGAGAPVTLLLFDLNGFKRFNDTFGHPAGDDLLVRLGEELREAVGEAGSVYRIGGDEFCVLAACPPPEVAALTRRAAAALTKRQAGVEVASSWGAVTLPEEASSPLEALQLADVRMYAQKESRRVARTQIEEPAPSITRAPTPQG
jgi:diguanylate cyclase (GGDEF)-like protein